MTPPLQPIKPESLRAQVEARLREAIVTGTFTAGQKLVERELCEMLDVSRPSLREALRTLAAEKLIVIVPNRGPEVAAMSAAEARDLFALRRLLESFAAHEFTRLASDEQVRRLAAAVRRLRQAGDRQARAGVVAAKAEFYAVLLEGAGNALVSEILSAQLARISLLRARSLMLPDRLPRSLDEIDALLACIQARDAKGAQKVSHRHVLHAERAALGVLEQQAAPPSQPQGEPA